MPSHLGVSLEMGGLSYMHLGWTFAGICSTPARDTLHFYQEFQGSRIVFRGLVKQGGSLGRPGTGLARRLDIGGVISPILQMKKVRRREAKSAAQGYALVCGKGWVGDRNHRLMPLDGQRPAKDRLSVLTSCPHLGPGPSHCP